MNTDFGKRLKEARKHAGLTQQQLAKKVGIGQSTIAELEKSGQGSSHVPAIAAHLRVSPLWLANGTGEMLDQSKKQPISLQNNPEYPAVRRVRFKLSAGATGFGLDYQDDEGNPLVFRRKWYEDNGYDPDALFATSVANGSMEPGLYDGDTVIVNTDQTEPKDGAVFAVNYEGEMVIKRLVRDDGQWWLASDNPDQRRYPRKVCHEGVSLIGEIVHKQSERI
ncbi:XRE family transcriptional regulator [Comamonas sp. UBA7528]|uniref:XRE family transcriptional regulator n=1 Tax=Comamonas sp. UBA7528 TaxID=1946391 RepID=UPI0025B9E95F|nr:S24 family peptidase [Comamonas sp. UBA7528]